MFANYLIGLREGLEAVLVVSILIAYLVKVDRRERLPAVGIGVALAVALSVAAGALLTFTSSQLSFKAQETFGGVMSIIAVGFVTWMVFWMLRAARSMRAELDGKVGQALVVGAFAVGLTAFLAVVREGLETALFFWSAAQAVGAATQPLLGFLLGIATAIVLGVLLYRRVMTLNFARFFRWTGAGLIIVAAGVLAYGIHDLQEADVIPGLTVLAFDISAQIPPDSWYGTLLKGVFNLSPQTTIAEAIAWSVYVVPVMILFLRGGRRRQRDAAKGRSGSAAVTAVIALAAVLVGAGCGSDGDDNGSAADGGGDKAISVIAKNDSCTVNTKSVEAGTHKVSVKNEGSRVTEVYVYAVGDRIMGEIENVTPQLSRTFSVALTPGDYEVACKPGMVGSGLRQPLAVSGEPPSADSQEQLKQAVSGYRRFVIAQTTELLRKTEIFNAALQAGDGEKAKSIYADTRLHYERIEPIAEAFAELDTAIDIRAGDVPMEKWTGFHRIERELWKNDDVAATKSYGKLLVKDVGKLLETVKTTEITPEQLANGARQLMDEVATGKITGEEERYSHTDLADFQANLDGAKAAYGELRPIVVERDQKLAELVDARFKRVQSALSEYGDGNGEFVTYDKLKKDDIRKLAAAVDGVSEPLSRVSGVVLK